MWNKSVDTNSGHDTTMNYVHTLKLPDSLLQRNDTFTIHPRKAMSYSNTKQIILVYCTIKTRISQPHHRLQTHNPYYITCVMRWSMVYDIPYETQSPNYAEYKELHSNRLWHHKHLFPMVDEGSGRTVRVNRKPATCYCTNNVDL
jgi:hypothetical protein